MRAVTERFRDRARAAIAALDRYRAPAVTGLGAGDRIPVVSAASEGERLRLGATVIYRPPGDRRAYSCIVDQVRDGFIHIVPQIPGSDGWIRAPEPVAENGMKELEEKGVLARKPHRRYRGTAEARGPGEHSR
jgi:hypothetical protein